MTAAELLADLRKRGIGIVREGQNLRLRAAKGMVTPDMLDLLKQHKPELLDLRHEERIRQQLAALVEHRTEDGRIVLVNPEYLNELDQLGLL